MRNIPHSLFLCSVLLTAAACATTPDTERLILDDATAVLPTDHKPTLNPPHIASMEVESFSFVLGQHGSERSFTTVRLAGHSAAGNLHKLDRAYVTFEERDKPAWKWIPEENLFHFRRPRDELGPFVRMLNDAVRVRVQMRVNDAGDLWTEIQVEGTKKPSTPTACT